MEHFGMIQFLSCTYIYIIYIMSLKYNIQYSWQCINQIEFQNKSSKCKSNFVSYQDLFIYLSVYMYIYLDIYISFFLSFFLSFCLISYVSFLFPPLFSISVSLFSLYISVSLTLWFSYSLNPNLFFFHCLSVMLYTSLYLFLSKIV